MADMHFMYGRANGSALAARRLYMEKFPNRRVPSHTLFKNLHHRLCKSDSFKTRHQNSGRPRSVSTPNTENRILRIVEENPGTSVRRISDAVGISTTLIWRTLHEQLLYPYHIQRVQALTPSDYQARMEFSQWLLVKCASNPNFVSRILFTDEASFIRNGITNFQNDHVRAEENPHALIQTNHQHRFSLNILMGIIGDHLIGPVILPNRLSGAAYLNFLVNTLPQYLDDMPLAERLSMWYMHDGAPPHFVRNVREHLNTVFGQRWIGCGGPVAWSPRSPDFNPLDFFLWGYLKTKVYSSPINDLEELRNRIHNACEIIRQRHRIFERVRESVRRRCQACMEMEGGHVEHLL
ncbi:uncharacterized protein LOC113562592 [Ooceraea biroi]|uniref:uncharacterized protein LOC113562592 n=1 Tax=Ooceraea biroi TaxID=2015173 RepID=UPI000F08AF27|nr:uncharacterized protein LOC113562592 [Ooceraea biroi]